MNAKRYFFIATGALLLALALALSINKACFIKTADAFPGKVDDFYNSTKVTIKFKDKNGQEMKFSQNGFFVHFEKGEQVQVLYKAGHTPVANTFGSKFGLEIVLLIIGAAFAFFSGD